MGIFRAKLAVSFRGLVFSKGWVNLPARTYLPPEIRVSYPALLRETNGYYNKPLLKHDISLGTCQYLVVHHFRWAGAEKAEQDGATERGKSVAVAVFHLSHEKFPGCLGYIGDYTTQLYADYSKPL